MAALCADDELGAYAAGEEIPRDIMRSHCDEDFEIVEKVVASSCLFALARLDIAPMSADVNKSLGEKWRCAMLRMIASLANGFAQIKGHTVACRKVGELFAYLSHSSLL